MSETQEDYEVQELSPRERLVEGIKERKKFLLFCGAAVGVMAYFAFHHRAPVASSSHLAPPPSMSATVGSAKSTPAYSDSIARDSEKRNETAEKTGSSSMTTVMRPAHNPNCRRHSPAAPRLAQAQIPTQPCRICPALKIRSQQRRRRRTTRLKSQRQSPSSFTIKWSVRSALSMLKAIGRN